MSPSPKKVTYADYLTWWDELRYEIINGIPILLETPLRIHQEIVIRFAGGLYLYLKNNHFKLYINLS